MCETEKFRLDWELKGLATAQLARRPAAVAVEGSKPLLAALDKFVVRVGVKRALEEVIVTGRDPV